MADSALNVGESSVVTFAFNEPVNGFSNADVVASNGTLSTVASADGGKTWKATFTPAENVEKLTNVISVSAAYADLAGNEGVSAASANYHIDTLAPRGTIVMADSTFMSGESALVTISFTEAVTGLSVSDLVVLNGTLSDLKTNDSGKTWFSTFTPSADVESEANTITLADTYTDLAGNSGLVSGSENYAIDTIAPRATIAISESALKSSESAVVTITFTEAVTGLSTTDFTALNGALSNLTTNDSGKTWFSTFTPSADVQNATNTIALTNTYTDLAGNTGVGSVSEGYAIDTKAPRATISMSDQELESGMTSFVTITFDEAVVGFSENNLSVVNGTLSNISEELNSKKWTAIFTPTANTLSLSPDNRISFNNTSVSDQAGNYGQGMSYSVVYGVFTATEQIPNSRVAPVLVHAFDSISFNLLSAMPPAVEEEVSVYLSVVTVDDVLTGKIGNETSGAEAGSVYFAAPRDALASRVMPSHVLGVHGKKPAFSQEAASSTNDTTYWFDAFSRVSVQDPAQDVLSPESEQENPDDKPVHLELDEKLTRNTTTIASEKSGLADTRQGKLAANVLASKLNRLDANIRLKEAFAERYLRGLSNKNFSTAAQYGNDEADTSTFGRLMLDSSLQDTFRESASPGHVLLNCLDTVGSNDDDLLSNDNYGASKGFSDSYVLGSPGEQPCAAGLGSFSQNTFEYWVDALALL